MNSVQESEFHLAIYHFFVWKAANVNIPSDDTKLTSSEISKNNAGAASGKDAKLTTSTTNTPATILLSQHYQKMADLMMEQSSHHLSQFGQVLRDNAFMKQTLPPVIEALFTNLPRLQEQVTTQQTRIIQLQNELLILQQQIKNGHNNQKRKPSTDSPIEIATKKKKSTVRPIETAQPILSKKKKNAPVSVKGLLQTNSTTEPEDLLMVQHQQQNAAFQQRWEELEYFARGNGHCRVPLKTSGALGRWVGELRKEYNHVVVPGGTSTFLTQERMTMLENIGFEWMISKPSKPWVERFEDLLAYKGKYGHCNIPREYKDDPALGEWIHMQRRLYREKSNIILKRRTGSVDGLHKSRAERLDEIGFRWRTSVIHPSFDERLEHCREFRRTYSHLRVPQPSNDKTSSNENGDDVSIDETLRQKRSFEKWAQRQRDEYRKFKAGLKSSLDGNRIRRLDELGFNWEGGSKQHHDDTEAHTGISTPGKSKNNVSFHERVAILREIKQKYGDCNEARYLKMAGYDQSSSLYQWIKKQRKQWKDYQLGQYSSLSEDRIRLLESVGFNFEPRQHYAAYGSKKVPMAEDENSHEFPNSAETHSQNPGVATASDVHQYHHPNHHSSNQHNYDDSVSSDES
jgi:Helicase associated domain